MKHGYKRILGLLVRLGCAFLIVFACTCCRTNKNSNKTVQALTEATETTATIRKDSTRTEANHKDSVSTAINTLEYTRTTTYGDAGGISTIQEQWRRTGSVGVSVSTGRTSEVSLSVSSDTTHIQTKSDMDQTQTVASESDTRPVQGSEWIAVIVGIGILVLIVLLFFYLKRRIAK